MKCEIKGCSRKRYGKKPLCYPHHRRLQKHGNTFADIPFMKCGSSSLEIRTKILQAQSGFRYCIHCKKYKKDKKFNVSRNRNVCKLCVRNWILKRAYNIDIDGYNELLKKQVNKCALCRTRNPGGKDSVFHVDHNHQTGKVRGLLCQMCNTLVIGGIENNNISIIRLIKYLKPSKTELRRISAYVKKVSNI